MVNYSDCMYTEVMLPPPIRWGSTYKIVKIRHVTSLAKSAECNDICFFTTEHMSNSYEFLHHNIA